MKAESEMVDFFAATLRFVYCPLKLQRDVHFAFTRTANGRE